MIQNDDHFLYFANNGGILEYNGETWNKVELNTLRALLPKVIQAEFMLAPEMNLGTLITMNLVKLSTLKFQNQLTPFNLKMYGRSIAWASTRILLRAQTFLSISMKT
jgi:hypothetical protein